MKNVILMFAMMMCVCGMAQNDTIPENVETLPDTLKEKKSTVLIEMGNRSSEKQKARVLTRWGMLDYGISTYLHDGKMILPEGMENMEQRLFGSSNWNLHLVQQRMRLDKKSHLNLIYGFTFEFNKYKFNHDATLLPKEEQVTFSDEGVELSKNMLSATYLEVPLMLNFRSRKFARGKRINVSFGGYAGVLIASKVKQKSEELGKVKRRDDYNLNRIKYGITARAGFGALNFYVNYGFSPLFKDGEQGIYDLQPLSMGIVLVPF